MSILSRIKTRPTKYVSRFNKHGLKKTDIANYLGYSYPYTCNLLNGVSRMTPNVRTKLDALLSKLERSSC